MLHFATQSGGVIAQSTQACIVNHILPVLMTRRHILKIDFGAEACVCNRGCSQAAVCDFINDAPHDSNWILIKFLRSSFLSCSWINALLARRTALNAAANAYMLNAFARTRINIWSASACNGTCVQPLVVLDSTFVFAYIN